MYQISYSKDFDNSMVDLPSPIQRKIEQILELLKNDPEYLLAESIKSDAWEYRYKLNSFYRLIYELEGKNITLKEIRDISNDLPTIEVVKITKERLWWMWITGLILLWSLILRVFIQVLNLQKQIEIKNHSQVDNIDLVTTGVWMNTWIFDQKYRYFSWEQVINLISSGDTLTIKKWATSNLWQQYPHIVVKNPNISWAILRVVIDFTDQRVRENWWYVYWYSISYDKQWNKIRKPAPWYVFALKFWFGYHTEWDVVYGGWYNVANYWIDSQKRLNNSIDLWLNGAYPGKDIVGGREYLIYLDEVNVAYQPRKTSSDSVFKVINPIEYLKKNLDKPLPVLAYLSDAWILWTKIVEMEIIYEWAIGAIQSYPQ